MFQSLAEAILPFEPVMADQIVITEKSSQAKDVRAAVGSRYGDVLPAEGHLSIFRAFLSCGDEVPSFQMTKESLTVSAC